jgi:thiamine pyrophosphate-dependent acetolactate synthase large subunit-like protein
MRSVLDGISCALGEGGILVADMTTIAYCGISEFPVTRAGGFLHPAGFGTLGFALPAAIGVSLRRDAPPVVVLAGDGGFQFTLQELAVAVQEQLPIPIVIWNDNGYGEIRREEEARHPGQRIAVDNLAPDFVALAEAYGAAARLVHDPGELAGAVREALTRPGPTIIEVPARDRKDSADE